MPDSEQFFPYDHFLWSFKQTSPKYYRGGSFVRSLTSIEIGKEIRKARKAQGLRQEDLAGLAGVGTRFVIEVERGKETSQMGRVLHLLAVLGCDISLRFPGETTGEHR